MLSIYIAYLDVFTVTNASSPYDCDFESGNLCQWSSIADNSLFDFKLMSKGNPTKGTGPEKDASGNVNGK